jgi:hypothetical protein
VVRNGQSAHRLPASGFRTRNWSPDGGGSGTTPRQPPGRIRWMLAAVLIMGAPGVSLLRDGPMPRLPRFSRWARP